MARDTVFVVCSIILSKGSKHLCQGLLAISENKKVSFCSGLLLQGLSR